MRWLLILISLLFLPAVASAQDCPDGTLEGESPDGLPCQLCRNGELEYLPPRTTCADDDRFACSEAGVTRAECVQPDPPNGDETMCDLAVPKGPACPNGLTCDMMEGYCRLFCLSAAECQDGFNCEDERCVRIPPPDMGMPPDDMGIPGDMGSDDDMGSGGDMGGRDMELPRDMAGPNDTEPAPKDDGGCCAVLGASPDSKPALVLLLAMLLLCRRRA